MTTIFTQKCQLFSLKMTTLFLSLKIVEVVIFNENTGGPPLTRFSLLRIPLPQFLAYVRASGGLPTVPLTQNLRNAVP